MSRTDPQMINASDYTGTKHFGRAYQRMYERDVHAPGSVDRILLEQMVQLRPETIWYLYSEFSPTTVHYPPAIARCWKSMHGA